MSHNLWYNYRGQVSLGQVDADADGVILLIRSIDDRDQVYGIREMGSSYSTTDMKLRKYSNTMYFVGLDASKHFEAYIENTNIEIYLVGQTKGSVIYYVDDIAVSDPTTGSWQQLDADDYSVDSGANGLILLLETTKGKLAGLRHADSTDDWDKKLEGNKHLQGAVGLNTANIWSEYIQGNEVNVFIAAHTLLIPMDVHADIDVLIRQADGTVRTTLATHVADSDAIVDDDWQSVTGSYAFPGYTVVDQTDFLEIDLFADVTNNLSEQSASLDFRIDDPNVAGEEQTRVRGDLP